LTDCHEILQLTYRYIDRLTLNRIDTYKFKFLKSKMADYRHFEKALGLNRHKIAITIQRFDRSS